MPRSAAVQYRAARTASYEVVNSRGTVVRRVLVGGPRGYTGKQYRDGYDIAKRTADGAARRTGEAFAVRFEPWSWT
jgi:hypothetical protein